MSIWRAAAGNRTNSTESDGAVANFLRGRGWHRRLSRLAVLLGSIVVCAALADSGGPRIILPLEVLGEDGTTVSSTIVLQPQQVDTVHSLWLRINGLRYPNQGSVQVNHGAWIPLQNENVAVDEPGKSYGGIDGGFATLSMRIAVSNGTVVEGMNTVRFRFNRTDGVSSGYRVLAWNFLTAEGAKIIPAEKFSNDNPDAWSAPLADKDAIQAGRELWQTAELTQSSRPNSPKIRAHCADCHTYDGRDLKYFNFSNHSIVTRSRFHGLSALQGEQIASYIRSLPFPNPGRPWNPPYQPGPGLDEQPVASWAAGAGIDCVLDQDVAALPHLVGQSSASPESLSAAPSQALDAHRLVAQITPQLFRPDGDLSARQIPIALQLPDWNEWLPRIHPKDAWGATFTQSKFGKLYGDGSYPDGQRQSGKSTLRAALAASQHEDSNLRSAAKAFDHWSRTRRAFLKSLLKSGTVWTPSLTRQGLLHPVVATGEDLGDDSAVWPGRT